MRYLLFALVSGLTFAGERPEFSVESFVVETVTGEHVTSKMTQAILIGDQSKSMFADGVTRNYGPLTLQKLDLVIDCQVILVSFDGFAPHFQCVVDATQIILNYSLHDGSNDSESISLTENNIDSILFGSLAVITMASNSNDKLSSTLFSNWWNEHTKPSHINLNKQDTMIFPTTGDTPGEQLYLGTGCGRTSCDIYLF